MTVISYGDGARGGIRKTAACVRQARAFSNSSVPLLRAQASPRDFWKDVLGDDSVLDFLPKASHLHHHRLLALFAADRLGIRHNEAKC